MSDLEGIERVITEDFIAVSGPLDLWLCIDGNYARPATKQETELLALVARLEARIAEIKLDEALEDARLRRSALNLAIDDGDDYGDHVGLQRHRRAVLTGFDE